MTNDILCANIILLIVELLISEQTNRQNMKKTTTQLHDLQTANPPTSFIVYLDAEIQRLGQGKHFGRAALIGNARNSFRHFLHSQDRDDVPLCELTTSLICAYQQWLADNGVKKNSASCYMRALQSAYNKTTAGMAGLPEKPFSKVYRGIAKTKKRAAGISVMQKVKTLDVRQGLIAVGKSAKRKTFPTLLRKMVFARDLFVFCYCARGMAFVDAAYLKKQDIRNGIIRYRRRKTGQLIEVAVEPMMREIINRHASAKDSPYLFPILPHADEDATYRAYRSALRTYNSHLKLLSTMLGEEVNLSSYVARHSWASNMHEMNMPISVISQGLGHESELTTRIYIKSLENNTIHEANRIFISQVFSYPLLSQERDNFGCKITQNILSNQKKRRKLLCLFCKCQ